MSETKARELIATYRSALRSALAEADPNTALAAEQAIEVLEARLKLPDRMSVGFVGESQVGKSSLINAILGRTTLPAGGIGPLTASATTVRFAEDPCLRVDFHGVQELHWLAFAVERQLVRTNQLQFGDRDPLEEASSVARDLPTLPQEIEGSDDGAREARAAATQKMTYMLEQARRLATLDVEGHSPAPVSDSLVLEILRKSLGRPARVSDEQLRPYEGRIRELAALLGKSETLRQSQLGHAKDFDKELRKRAAGWMSPLVARLDVELDSEFLKDMDLTDLPGVGVVGDPAAETAQQFVSRENATLVLVMRNNGVTAELARLLEKTGVVRRLLFGGRDGRTPIHVIIAITHLDDVVRERVGRLSEQDDEEVDPDQIFRELSADMRNEVRHRLGLALRDSDAFEGLDQKQRERRQTVILRLCQEMQIECVASPDFADLTYRARRTSRPMLRTPEATAIPRFRACLHEAAQLARGNREQLIEEGLRELVAILSDHCAAMDQLYAEGGGQAQVAWDSFRKQLARSLAQLEPEMGQLQKDAAKTLRADIPERIGEIAAQAEKVATAQLQRLIAKGKDLHYQSLNAALLRNGVWETRGLDFPDKLTSSLVDSIASEWETQVIDALRLVLKQLASGSIGLVEALCEAASRLDEKIVTDAQIEAQKKMLLHQANTAVSWTKEKLETLREEVQKELYESVIRPIEKACKEAVDQRANRSDGAKTRILETFRTGGTQAIRKAREKAKLLLESKYKEIHQELSRTFFKEHHDPVRAAYESLTSETLLKARRSDGQKRRHVMREVERIREALAGRVLARSMEGNARV